MSRTADHLTGVPEARPYDDRDDFVVTRDDGPVRPGMGGPLLVALAALLVAAAVGVAMLASDDGGDRAATPQWSGEVQSSAGRALVAGDLVGVGQDQRLLGGRPAEVHAFERSNGEEVWRADLEAPSASPVAVTADGALVVRTSRQVAVLDVTTGEVRWRHSYDADRPQPVVTGDALLVGGGALMAADLSDGDVLWRSDLASDVAPVVADGVAYVAAADAVGAVSLEDGRQVWLSRLDESSAFTALPLVTPELVVAGSNDGEVLAVSRSDGERVWSVRTDSGDAVTAVFGVEGDSVIAGGDSGRLYSFDLTTGERRWSVPTDSEFTGAEDVVLVDGVIVVGTPPSTHVVAVDADTGRPRWSEQVGAIGVPPVVLDGDVLTGVASVEGTDGRVVALDPGDGAQVWDAGLSHPPFGRMVPSGDGGVVVISGRPGETTDLVTLLR